MPPPPPCPRWCPQFDWRFGALVRLVKLWARRHNINDSTAGTLNSFALTLLVRAPGWDAGGGSAGAATPLPLTRHAECC